MLSIILYGRNDAHGYNLHKRAALSLNCLAEVLSDPADEIIFVDYNTPNELPTFPEAIADTLTDTCKSRLRTLRVRPSYHTQFTGRTRLVALESQSRNIAIRRANPANRWILSTNTDMIFCAADPKASLSDIIGGLDDGFYHLPRFEVPEGFWERLSRDDPQTAIAAMRENGRRFHLNEIVYGTVDNIYEAPGDFQLFLRSDLEAIDGFDERMLLGWHVDSNIARRMRLLRGDIVTLEHDLAGYHCGHTRQATSLHGGDRTENDRAFFVRGLTGPQVPEQRDTWGAPNEVIEEVRLDRPDPYFPALTRAVTTTGPQLSEATYNDSSLDKVTYEVDHVLPHLCDLLHNLPPRQTYFFSGDDVALLEGVRTYLDTVGRDADFLVADDGSAPDLSALDPQIAERDARPLKSALEAADILILQFPSADLPAERREALEWRCHQVFGAVVAMERARPVSQRRRVIFINSTHTSITVAVEQILAPTNTPFSARIRQGFVQDEAAAVLKGPEAEVCRRLGRTTPFGIYDVTYLRGLMARLEAGEPPLGWERLAPEIAAIATSPAESRRYFGLSDETARTWGAVCEDAMRQGLLRAVDRTSFVSHRSRVGNRLCSGLDWESPAWAQKALLFMGPHAGDIGERTRWVWERTSLADCIAQFAPVDPLGLSQAPRRRRVLFVADRPDLLSAILASLGYEVACVTPEALLQGKGGDDWREALRSARVTMPASFHPLSETDAAEGFDIGVVTLPSLFEKGDAAADAILGAMSPRMAKDAFFFASATVQLNEIAYEGGFSYAEWRALFTPEGPLGGRGFTEVGGMDPRAPMDVVLRFAANDDAQEATAGLSYGFLKGFNTSAVLAARWPAELKSAPAERLVHTDPPVAGRELAPIPYLGQVTDGEAAATVDAPLERDEAAKAAAFLIAHPLEQVARDALAQLRPVVVSQTPCSAVPFVASLQDVRRDAVGVDLGAPGGAGFSLVFDPKTFPRTIIRFGDSPAATISEAVVVDRDGRAVSATPVNGGLEIATAGASGPLAAAIRFEAPSLSLAQLTIAAA
jgi:hypothetical protein